MNKKKLAQMMIAAMNGQNDEPFEKVLKGLHCMSTPRLYSILNACVSSLEPGELYVEVGCYQGGSIISALLGNETKAIAVDSFDQFTGTNSAAITKANFSKFDVAERVELYDQPFQEFFANLDKAIKIQVYNYDGAHDEETQLEGMEAAWPFLHKGSLILVDDYSYPEVSRAVARFVSNHAYEIQFLFVWLPEDNQDKVWWNGVVVLRVT